MLTENLYHYFATRTKIDLSKNRSHRLTVTQWLYHCWFHHQTRTVVKLGKLLSWAL